MKSWERSYLILYLVNICRESKMQSPARHASNQQRRKPRAAKNMTYDDHFNMAEIQQKDCYFTVQISRFCWICNNYCNRENSVMTSKSTYVLNISVFTRTQMSLWRSGLKIKQRHCWNTTQNKKTFEIESWFQFNFFKNSFFNVNSEA